MIADKPRLFFLSESCFDRASKTRWVTHKGSLPSGGHALFCPLKMHGVLYIG